MSSDTEKSLPPPLEPLSSPSIPFDPHPQSLPVVSQITQASSDIEEENSPVHKLHSLEHSIEVSKQIQSVSDTLHSRLADTKLTFHAQLEQASQKIGLMERSFLDKLQEVHRVMHGNESDQVSLRAEHSTLKHTLDEFKARLASIEEASLTLANQSKAASQHAIQMTRQDNEVLKTSLQEQLHLSGQRLVQHKADMDRLADELRAAIDRFEARLGQTETTTREALEKQREELNAALSETANARREMQQGTQQALDHLRETVSQQLEADRASQQVALTDLRQVVSNVKLDITTELEPILAELGRVLESEKKARIAAEGELRRLVAREEQSRMRGDDDHKARLDALELKVKEESASAKQALQARMEEERRARTQTDADLQQQLEESTAAIRSSLRARFDEARRSIEQEVSARQTAITEVTASVQACEAQRGQSECALRSLVEQHGAGLREDICALRGLVETTHRDESSKRAALDSDLKARTKQIELTVNQHAQDHVSLAEELRARVHQVHEYVIQSDTTLNTQLTTRATAMEDRMTTLAREFGDQMVQHARCHRDELDDLRDKTEAQIAAAQSQFRSLHNDAATRLDAHDQAIETADSALKEFISQERATRASEIRHVHARIEQRDARTADELVTLRESLTQELASEKQARATEVHSLQHELNTLRTSTMQDAAQQRTGVEQRVAQVQEDMTQQCQVLQDDLAKERATRAQSIEATQLRCDTICHRFAEATAKDLALLRDGQQEARQHRAQIQRHTQQTAQALTQAQQANKQARLDMQGDTQQKLQEMTEARADWERGQVARVEEYVAQLKTTHDATARELTDKIAHETAQRENTASVLRASLAEEARRLDASISTSVAAVTSRLEAEERVRAQMHQDVCSRVAAVDTKQSTAHEQATADRARIEESFTQRLAELADTCQSSLAQEVTDRKHSIDEQAHALHSLTSTVAAHERDRAVDHAAVRAEMEQFKAVTHQEFDKLATTCTEARSQLQAKLQASVDTLGTQTTRSLTSLQTATQATHQAHVDAYTHSTQQTDAALQGLQQQLDAEAAQRVKADQELQGKMDRDQLAQARERDRAGERMEAMQLALQASDERVQKELTAQLTEESAAREADTRALQTALQHQHKQLTGVVQSTASAIRDEMATENAAHGLKQDALFKAAESLRRALDVEAAARSEQCETVAQAAASTLDSARADLVQELQALETKAQADQETTSDALEALRQSVQRCEEARIAGDAETRQVAEQNLSEAREQFQRGLSAAERSIAEENAKRLELEKTATGLVAETNKLLATERSERSRDVTQLNARLEATESQRGESEAALRTLTATEGAGARDFASQLGTDLKDRMRAESTSLRGLVQETKEALELLVAQVRGDATRQQADTQAALLAETQQRQSELQQLHTATDKTLTDLKQALQRTHAEGTRQGQMLSERVKELRADLQRAVAECEEQRAAVLQAAQQHAGTAATQADEAVTQKLQHYAAHADTQLTQLAQQSKDLRACVDRMLDDRAAFKAEARQISEEAVSQLREESSRARKALSDRVLANSTAHTHLELALRESLAKCEQQQDLGTKKLLETHKSILERVSDLEAQTAQMHGETVTAIRAQLDALSRQAQESATRVEAAERRVGSECGKLESGLRAMVAERQGSLESKLGARCAEIESAVRSTEQLREESMDAVRQDLDLISSQSRTLATDTASSIADLREALTRDFTMLQADVTQRSEATERDMARSLQAMRELVDTHSQSLTASYEVAMDDVSKALQTESEARTKLEAQLSRQEETATQRHAALTEVARLHAEVETKRLAERVLTMNAHVNAVLDEFKNANAQVQKQLTEQVTASQQALEQETSERKALGEMQIKALARAQELFGQRFDQMYESLMRQVEDARQEMRRTSETAVTRAEALESEYVQAEVRNRQRADEATVHMAQETQLRSQALDDLRLGLAQLKADLARATSELDRMTTAHKTSDADTDLWREALSTQLRDVEHRLAQLGDNASVQAAMNDARLLSLRQELKLNDIRIRSELNLDGKPRGADVAMARRMAALRADPTILEAKYNEWYRPSDPTDKVDIAVQQTLRSLRFPVRIHMPRLGPGVYLAENRKLHIILVNGNTLVRRGGGYEALYTYLYRLFGPELGLEVPTALVNRPSGLTCPPSPTASCSSTPPGSPGSPRSRPASTARTTRLRESRGNAASPSPMRASPPSRDGRLPRQ